MARAWALFENAMSEEDRIVYFPLELSSDEAGARVKMHIVHLKSTAATISHEYIAICPDTD